MNQTDLALKFTTLTQRLVSAGRLLVNNTEKFDRFLTQGYHMNTEDLSYIFINLYLI